MVHIEQEQIELSAVPHQHIGTSNREISADLRVGNYVVLGSEGNLILFYYHADKAVVLLLGEVNMEHISTAEQLLKVPNPKVILQLYRHPNALYWNGSAWQQKPMRQININKSNFAIGSVDFPPSVLNVGTLNDQHLDISRRRKDLSIRLNTYRKDSRMLYPTVMVTIVSNRLIDTEVSQLMDDQTRSGFLPQPYVSPDPHGNLHISRVTKVG